MKLVLATFRSIKAIMSTRRLLFLCLLAVSLGFSGPLTRVLSSQAAAVPQTMAVSVAIAATDMKTSATPSKRCQRSVSVGSNCHIDFGAAVSVAQPTHAVAVSALEIRNLQAVSTPPATRVFRPPRVG
ncbi:hypothetical protein [Hoeflea halophila]|uniref:hypothetical protein n=1 Tax=Hoeflea halophila TaxID=714899 RepID=UPI001179AD72|nr:hypothetical protein [Hoeflea halophila]